MNKDIKKYSVMLMVSIFLLLTEVIFKFKGSFGLILCIVSIYFIISLSIRIIRLTNFFDENIMEKIDILLFL